MNELVIFGAGDIGQLAQFYFEHQNKYRPVAFVVDDEYKNADEFSGLPVITASELESKYPANKYAAFAAMSYSKMNKIREAKYRLLKDMGYEIATYISPYCSCFTKEIGENCFILEDNTLQPFVKVGNNVTMWSGNHIGHHSVIGDNCFITSHVVISGGVTMENNCFIGVNATLRDHIRIGQETFIAAGALILKDTEARQVLKTPPAEVARMTSDKITKI